MHPAYALSLLWLAQPFWEVKSPETWTGEELLEILTDSPWAQSVDAAVKSTAPPVRIFLATAAPVRFAETRLRKTKPGDLEQDYLDFLVVNEGKVIVLAVELKGEGLSDAEEVRRMERECVLRVGRKKLKLLGHFPPSASDPYLRLAFPREAPEGEKRLRFELYLPSLPSPYRQADFDLRTMIYRGQAAF